MTTLEKITLWQTIFTAVAVIVASAAAYLAYRIGKKQNKINEIALSITNFVEIFLMPSQVTLQDANCAEKKFIKFAVLIKNVSSYPVYLNSYSLNGVKNYVGSSALPNNLDSWYTVPITDDIQDKGEFSLLVEFEDYLGKKYKAEGSGIFRGTGWEIKSRKREEV